MLVAVNALKHDCFLTADTESPLLPLQFYHYSISGYYYYLFSELFHFFSSPNNHCLSSTPLYPENSSKASKMTLAQLEVFCNIYDSLIYCPVQYQNWTVYGQMQDFCDKIEDFSSDVLHTDSSPAWAEHFECC